MGSIGRRFPGRQRSGWVWSVSLAEGWLLPRRSPRSAMFREGEGGRGRRCWCWRYMSRGGREGSVSCVGHRRKGLAPLRRLRLPPPHWQERPATHCPSRVVVAVPAANPPPPALPPRGSFAGAIRPFFCRRCHKSARGEKEKNGALSERSGPSCAKASAVPRRSGESVRLRDFSRGPAGARANAANGGGSRRRRACELEGSPTKENRLVLVVPCWLFGPFLLSGASRGAAGG